MRLSAKFAAFIYCLLSRKNLKAETNNCLAYSILALDGIYAGQYTNSYYSLLTIMGL